MPEQFKYAYRVQTLDLTSGLTNFVLPLHGETVTYAAPTDGPEISIRLQSASNDAIPLRPQGEITAPFTRLYVSASAYAGTVSLLIAGPKDIKLTGRDVSINGNVNAAIVGTVPIYQLHQARALAADLFACGYQFTKGAGTSLKMQLWNPIGNTVSFMVHRIGFLSDRAMQMQLRTYNTALGAVVANSCNNTNIGGPAFSGELRVLDDATSPGSTLFYSNFDLTANQWLFLPEEYCLIVGPGEGIITVGSTAAGTEKLQLAVSEF